MKETDRKKGNEAIAHRWVLVTFHWLHLLRLCGLLFAGRFLITIWISLLVMGLLRSSISTFFFKASTPSARVQATCPKVLYPQGIT